MVPSTAPQKQVVNTIYSEANKLSPVWSQFILMQLCLSAECKTREELRMLRAYQVTAVFPPSGKQGGRTVACLNILAAFISFGLLPNGEQYGHCFLTFPTSPFQEIVHNAFLPESMSTYVSYRHKVSVLHSLLLMKAHKTHFSSFPLLLVCI